MWLTKLFSTVSYFDKPIFCEKHDSAKIKIMSKEEIKQSEEIFCVLAYIRKRVMDPFYYNAQYPSTVLGTWCKQLKKFPWESYMSWDQLEEEMDLVHLIHDITTYTLAALTKVCVFCEKSNGSFSTWVNNTKGDTDLWHCLKGDCVDFKRVLASSSEYQKILDEMYGSELLTAKDYQFVDAAFFVTFMIRYSVFSSESVESIIASNLKIMEHTKKFTLEFPIGEDHLKVLEGLSQQLVMLKGDEKESFSILLDLVKQAATSLKLKKYKEAEVYGHAIVTLVPSWCQGCFYLATAVYLRGERVHFALRVATLGLQNCANVQCPSCETFRLLVQKWQQEFSPVCKVSRADKLATEGHKLTVRDMAKKNLSREADDVPELTDPSSSDDSCSNSEADYDAVQEEIPEISQALPETKEVKQDVVQEEIPEINQPLPEIKEVKPKTISEQNEVAKPAKEVDPKPPKSTPKKAEKARHRKESSDVTLSVMEIQEKVERFKILLKEGSAAATDGCGLSAVRNFYDALSELKATPNLYKLEEYEIVCLKYAYGSSCCKAGTYEDLNKAITVFNEILNDHQNVRFLVAYYGLGLVHFKLNRFKEALSHFEMLQFMVDKGIHYPVYTWPGTVNAIEETKIEKLKVLLTDLVVKCRSPPSPAAVCRYENCLCRPEIYYSDPDFKGFTIIQCQDRCVLQYHPPCWKTLKDALNRTDKDFLGQQCLTPDCEFAVMQIECIGKDGTIEKHFEIEDNEKLKKHKKSRLEKRLVMKELKKRRRLESQNAMASESSEICDNNEDELPSESIPTVTDHPVVKEIENSEIVVSEASKKIESNLSANAKPFYVKKDKDAKENIKACYLVKKDVNSVCENEKVIKTKERKKAKKPVALSLEEFRQKNQDFSYYSEYKMRLHHLQQNKSIVEDRQTQWSTICETEKIPHLDPNRPFYIPEDLRDNPLALDAVLQSYSSFGKTDFSKISKEKIYVHLEKILSWYGPMRVDDPVLLEEVSNFPGTFQQMISDAGGLKDFLLASMRFAFVGDHISIISDVVKAYSLGSKSYNSEGGYSSGCDRLEDYEIHSNGTVDEDDFCGENNKFHSLLNPHATEYNPVSPVLSKSSIASGSSNCSSEAYQNDVCVKELEQESLVDPKSSLNKLREPLLYNGQSLEDPEKNSAGIYNQHLHEASLNGESETPPDNYFFSDPYKAFEHLGEDIKNLPHDKKFVMILQVLKFVLNDQYYAENISLFNQHIKPFIFTHIPKRQNKCLQAGTPDINMHSKAVMKDDEHLQTLIENFHDLEHYRNNMNEEKKIVEEKLEHSLDTIAQLQNALAVAEIDREKKVEEIQALLEEEKKELKRKEKRSELNQAKLNEQLKGCREEIKKLKDELAKKDAQLKDVEDLKKATEIDLENESKAKNEVETSLHETLQFHEIEVSSFTKKLQNAQLEILTVKKNNVLEKISVSSKNAELRLKEIQDGLPMVSHPLFLEQLKSLQSQIKEYIVKLGKIHCEFVKAADEQINELKKGKDLSDLEPLVEPTLSECPALKAPPNPVSSVTQSANNSVAPGGSTPPPGHPYMSDSKSMGLMLQAPNSSSVQPLGQIYNPVLKTFHHNQKMATSQGASFHGTSVLGNIPSLNGSNVTNINPYPVQNLSVMNPSGLFDSTLYPSATSVYPQKLASNFQPNTPRAHMPPGLSVPMHSSSQGLPNSLPQMSSMFHFPQQTTQQNTSATNPMLQSPFSFGFPQLHNRAATSQFSTSEKIKTSERSSPENSVNACKKSGTENENNSPLNSATHSEKSISKEHISEAKNSVSNPASLDSVLSPVEKRVGANSTCSSPLPIQSTRDKSDQSDSSYCTSVPGSDPPAANKQAPTFVDLEATGVKLKQPVANAKQKKIMGSSLSGASSVVSDHDTFNLDSSVPEGSALELGYTVKETREASKTKNIPSSSIISGFSTAVKATPAAPKNVPTTTSYEKLLGKLMVAYPQHSRTELMECIGEFRRNNNNKLSNLKFGNIISGIGEILERRKNHLVHTVQKRKPQLQVVSLTRKKSTAPPPPAEKSGICPWAKPEPQSMLTHWHEDNADTSCSICLEDMTIKCTIKKLECGHRFHMMCLKEWLDKNSNCPICRVHVLLPEDYPSLT